MVVTLSVVNLVFGYLVQNRYLAMMVLTHTVSGTAASNGNHAHTVGIGAHSHTVSGNTGGTGSGSAFSVTNQFYKLMAWVRTA